MVAMLIDAYEGIDIATYDVPGAYIHASLSPNKSKERVLMKLEEQFVDIMYEVNPEQKKNVIYEKGEKVLCMEIMMVIYRAIEYALRWYDLYSQTLEKEGFIINSYDKCVANKIIDDKQCTVVWYVDNNKISYTDENVVTNVIELMKGYFGDLTVMRVKQQTFLVWASPSLKIAT